MVQIKKPKLKQAILSASFDLFSENGYHSTTIAQIAKRAGVSTANVYNYFSSKVEILYAIYEPWLLERLDKLEVQIARTRSPRAKIYKILHALWCDIPSEDNAFAHNFVQAIATIDRSEGYRPELLKAALQRVQSMLLSALPESRRRTMGGTRLANVVLMAFDGFVIVRHLNPGQKCDHGTINLFVDLLMPGKA